MKQLVLVLLLNLSIFVHGHGRDYSDIVDPMEIVSERARHFMAYWDQTKESLVKHRRRPVALAGGLPVNELVVYLKVGISRFSNSFMSFNTRAYNGSFPAPTIRVAPGDRLTIVLENGLLGGEDNYTNIHTHGLHVSSEGLADNIFQQVKPGESRRYVLDIKKDHPSGTYWYHPHHHGAVNSQLTGMMSGVLIVQDDLDGESAGNLGMLEEQVMLLQGACFNDCDNRWDNIEDAIQNQYIGDTQSVGRRVQVDLELANELPLNSTASLHVLINGQFRPKISMRPGQIKRFRYVNAIANNMVEIAPTRFCTMHLLARDGMYRDAPKRLPILVVPPGGRADVAIQCSKLGSFDIKIDRDLRRNHMLGMPHAHRALSQVIATLEIQGEPLNMVLPESLPKRPDAFLVNRADDVVPISNRYNYEFSVWKQNGVVQFGVNQKSFDSNFINHTMKVNQLQEWTLSTHSYHMCGNDHSEPCHKMNHPFHIHSTHFQIVSVDTAGESTDALYELGEWRDTLPLFRDTVKIRFLPRQVGRMLSHCHVAAHSDEGMGQLFHVT